MRLVTNIFMRLLICLFHDCILTIRFAGMGNLLKVLTREIENYPHFFLDFERKSGAGVERKEKGLMWGGFGRRGSKAVTSSAVFCFRQQGRRVHLAPFFYFSVAFPFFLLLLFQL